MLKLYVKTGCPYCAAVITKLNELSVSFEERNIADPEVAKELIARGGKRQVPYLVDEDVRMYESADIVQYLQENYSSNK